MKEKDVFNIVDEMVDEYTDLIAGTTERRLWPHYAGAIEALKRFEERLKGQK